MAVRLTTIAERCLWGVALLCLAATIVVETSARAAQREAEVPPTPAKVLDERGPATVIGRLEIPGVGLRVPMMSDYRPASLLRGVGHIQGTANPGGLGNLVLAGHRDTFFKPLRRIGKDMEMRVVTGDGVYRYLVDRTELVKPEQVDVLSIGDRPEMTLITCYPFDYIGAAPERFIVHAHLVSADASGR